MAMMTLFRFPDHAPWSEEAVMENSVWRYSLYSNKVQSTIVSGVVGEDQASQVISLDYLGR